MSTVHRSPEELEEIERLKAVLVEMHERLDWLEARASEIEAERRAGQKGADDV